MISPFKTWFSLFTLLYAVTVKMLHRIIHKKMSDYILTKEPTPLKIDDSTHKKDTSGEIPHQTVSVCSSCQRIVKLDAVYELGKTWCKDCYKTHVLKVKS